MKVVLDGSAWLTCNLPGDVRWCEAKMSRLSRPLNTGISVRCGKDQPIGG
jgi:hypothetical protein